MTVGSGSSPQSVLGRAAIGIREELADGDPDFALRFAMDAFKRLKAMDPETLGEPLSTGTSGGMLSSQPGYGLP